MLATVISSLLQMLTGLFSSLASIGVLLAVGAREGKQKATIEALQEAQNENKNATNARRASTLDSDRGGLLTDDGFKRD